jgi:pimeloyl-ACP methyl ester carboxylesterase
MGDAMTGPAVLKHVRTPMLEIAYEESGPGNGIPVILLHGFPYDPRAYDVVVPPLVNAGCRTIVPYLRGFGPTRFLVGDVSRSGQQAALGQDLVGLLDALALPRAVLVGYDWGGRAACIAAALWPERVRGLVSIGGYNIQDIAGSVAPQSPEQEYRYWYQYYFQTERGRAGLHAHRRELCRLLWRLWSPHWQFDDVAYDRTAASFNNPDFVEVVIHSYRHRFGSVPGDPALEAIEQRLAAQPPIRVPTVVLHGGGDGVTPPEGSAEHARYFTGPFQRRVIPMAGHNLPQEVPGPVVDAVRALLAG